MIQDLNLKKLEHEASEIVISAGKLVNNSFGEANTLILKDSRDFATKTDIETEEFLREKLHQLLPDAGFIVEEGETKTKNIYNWIIDPIDQTKNFASNLPMFFIQLALLKNNIPILGIIYQPIADQLFTASLNNGTKLNGSKLTVNESRTIESAIIEIDIRGNNNASLKHSIFRTLFPLIYRIRISGGAFPIYMTTGSIDGYIKTESNEKKFDLLPRIIIFQESGFKTEYLRINETECFIAGNKNIFPVLKKVLINSTNHNFDD